MARDDYWNDPTYQPGSNPNAPYGDGPGQTPPPGQPGGPSLAAPPAPKAGAGAPGQFDGYDITSLTIGSNGDIYGQQRVITGDPNTPGQTKYGYKTVDLGNRLNLQAVADASGIPLADLQNKLPELDAEYKAATAAGYGHIIGANPDGSYTYEDNNGVRKTSKDLNDLAGQGISPAEIAQAKAQAGETQRTITQMGQFSVAGVNPDGSLQVRDYNGTLSTVTAQDAASGKIPGVSYADFQKAQADFVNNAKTLTAAGQYEAITANPDGTVTVKDGMNNYKNVSAAAAGQLPGVSPGQVQYLMQQGQDRNYLGGPATSFAALGNGGGPAAAYPAIAGAGFATNPGGPSPQPPLTSGAPMNGTPGVGTASGLPSGGSSGDFTQQQQQQPSIPKPPQANAYGSALAQGGYGAASGLPSGSSSGTGSSGGYGAQVSQATGGGTAAPMGGGGYGQQPPQQQGGGPTMLGLPTRQPPVGGGYGQQPPQQGGGGPTMLGLPTRQPPVGGGAPAWSNGTFNGSGFSGSNQDQQQYIQSLQNYYNIGQGQYNIAHQQTNQQNDLYRMNQGQTQQANQSANRNVGGMGFAGMAPTRLAGQ